jgi:glycosyl transferase family 2
MKVDVYCVMRNEAALLPYWLRHYGPLARRIFVYDGGSDDGSFDLLRDWTNVYVVPCGFDGLDDFAMARLFSTAYRELSRGGVDWVICVDADEFVYDPDLSYRLSQLSNQGEMVIQCEGWNMLSETFPAGSGQIYDEIKRGVPDPYFSKPVVFNPIIDIEFVPGRHSAKHIPFRAATGTGIKLLHYRWLGEEYGRARSSRNADRITPANRVAGHGVHNDPAWTGVHSPEWFKKQMAYAKDAL